MSFDLTKAEKELGEAPAPTEVGPPEAKPLSELVRPTDGDLDELLRHRYLCRGAGLLLVGPTGAGKSSLAIQAMIHWAIGKPLFEIEPTKALKSLLVQAENDEGDLAEMRDGVVAGLSLTPRERQTATDKIIVAREDIRTGMSFLAGAVRPLLEQHKPDLLWIDAALAYLGGEFTSQKDVGGFLRNGLNPLLRMFGCGGVVLHHTNKPLSGKEKPVWSAGDLAYLGGGSAEWANWARAVLALRSLGSHSVFELRAGKRGERLGWKDEDGEAKAYSKLIAHAKEPGVICWREADEKEMPEPTSAKRVPSKEDIMRHVPMVGSIPKDDLRVKANAAGIALNRINPLIEELVQEGRLYVGRQKRSGTNARKMLSRTPQPVEELMA